MRERFCAYGGANSVGHFVLDDGNGLTRTHPATKSQRWMCAKCRSIRQLSRVDLEKLNERERSDRLARNRAMGRAAAQAQQQGKTKQ